MMIKSILFIALFSGLVHTANFQKLVCTQSLCVGDKQVIKEKDPFKIFLQSLAKAPLINIPYGNKSILKKFPTQWSLPNNKNTSQNKIMQALQSNYNSLDSAFYGDVENRKQLKIEANYIVAQKLFSSSFIRFDDSLKINKKAFVKVVALSLNNTFKTYSLIIGGNRTCSNCEYPTHQTEIVLVNIDKQNNVIDKLMIGSIVGNDLGSTSKFFFIDENKIIHIKDFLNDELTVNFKKYKQYKIMPDGHFLENIKNKKRASII
jgi:hypothetical protein